MGEKWRKVDDEEDDDEVHLNIQEAFGGVGEEIWLGKGIIRGFLHGFKNSLGNLLTGLVAVYVGQLSAYPGTSKSKGKEVLGDYL
ncbi:hypothetical protein Sjap_026446 [Stephania japonica]|uniref:Uncharacterized protein n=1 Tax=Stephania japonica TaxID=461633 RepID=A0AAP0E3J3_9MAGN